MAGYPGRISQFVVLTIIAGDDNFVCCVVDRHISKDFSEAKIPVIKYRIAGETLFPGDERRIFTEVRLLTLGVIPAAFAINGVFV
jgi:hypothetical protein